MFVGAGLREAEDLQVTLRRRVEGLQPGDVPLDDAVALWRAYDGIERLASAAKMLLATRVDESRVWAREGDRSAVDYLARVSGASRGGSRSLLDTSKKVGMVPKTEAALRRGELSRPQAEAIADAAAANPGAEEDLLTAASRESLAELRERCARAKAAADPDPDARHRRIHRDRRLRQYTDAEGAWNAIMRGTPDAGAVFNAALQPIMDELFQQARREGRSEPRETYAFDAAIELARRVHTPPDDVDDEMSGPVDDDAAADDTGSTDASVVSERRDGDDTGSHTGATEHRDANDLRAAGPDAGVTSAGGGRLDRRGKGSKKRSKRTNPRFLALLRVDFEALQRGRVDGDELCEITGVGPVPARVARELLGDSILKLVITKGVDVVNVTSLGRGPTAAQRIAALWSSPYCTNQGCPHVVNIQHDHRQPWAQVHETALGNLDRLCGACHYLKTHKGWALVEGKGRRPLVPPNDPRHPNNSSSRTAGPNHHAPRQDDTPGAGEALRYDATLFETAA